MDGASPSGKGAGTSVPVLGLGFEALPSLGAVMAAQEAVCDCVNDRDTRLTLGVRGTILAGVAAMTREAADFRALAADARRRAEFLRDLWAVAQR